MKATFQFLKRLKSHNKREWFEAHRDEFLESKDEFTTYVDGLLQLIRKFDRKIEKDTGGADYVFRIYRDIRFSKDKTPYKTHFGASINPGGRKSPAAGYYIHVEPGNSFAAGGVWMPEPKMLQGIRQEIDYNPAPLMKIMRSANFRKYFKGLDDEAKLKTVPKGYDKDHPHIELLKNKHFILSHNFSDKQVLSRNFVKDSAAVFKAMYPMMEYLREASSGAEH